MLDILMLTGAVVLTEIYHTPTGPTLYANIVSEIVVALPYTALALYGSVRFLRNKDNKSNNARSFGKLKLEVAARGCAEE